MTTDITDKLNLALLAKQRIQTSQILECAEAHDLAIDSDEEESWIRAFSENGDFILAHRRLPIVILRYGMHCQNSIEGIVIQVSSYESRDLSVNRQNFDIEELGWHTSLYPEDEDGIDLSCFSASDLFYATV